jgi:hypothetical protein
MSLYNLNQNYLFNMSTENIKLTAFVYSPLLIIYQTSLKLSQFWTISWSCFYIEDDILEIKLCLHLQVEGYIIHSPQCCILKKRQEKWIILKIMIAVIYDRAIEYTVLKTVFHAIQFVEIIT